MAESSSPTEDAPASERDASSDAAIAIGLLQRHKGLLYSGLVTFALACGVVGYNLFQRPDTDVGAGSIESIAVLLAVRERQRRSGAGLPGRRPCQRHTLSLDPAVSVEGYGEQLDPPVQRRAGRSPSYRSRARCAGSGCRPARRTRGDDVPRSGGDRHAGQPAFVGRALSARQSRGLGARRGHCP